MVRIRGKTVLPPNPQASLKGTKTDLLKQIQMGKNIALINLSPDKAIKCSYLTALEHFR